MLSKNSTLGMLAVLLFSNASLLFSTHDEEATMKRAVRVASVDTVLRAQALGIKGMDEEEDTTEEEETEDVERA